MASAQPGLSPEVATAFREIMLQGFANEIQITKKVFSAIPEDKRDYKPDPHARTAWELAWHIANTDVQFLDGIADLKFTMQGRDENEKPKTVNELVSWYDQNCSRGMQRVRSMSPEQLATSVDFMGIFNFPSALYLSFLNNHSIHHRGELATYLRPMGSKVPSIYGGSYDEPFMPEAAGTAA